MDRRALGALVRSSLREGADLRRRLADSCTEPLLDAAFAVASRIAGGGKMLVFGNGGSAADAQHLAAEFVGRLVTDRRPLPAIALTTDTSALTAIGNDYGYEQIFARQVSALALPQDVVVAISTSGRSPNVLAALRSAREIGALTIAFTGGAGNPASELADIGIVVPASETQQIQECHLAMEHLLCACVEALLGYGSWDETSTDAAGQRATRGRERLRRKVVDVEHLLAERQQWATQGRTVVWTNGCFDVVHAGHVESLFHASQFGDVLVVGINDDDSVRRLKGPGRPVIDEGDRAVLLSAFEFVDRVVVYPDDTPERMLQRLKPDVHCKGEDYAPPDGKPIPEASVVASYGGRVEFLPLLHGRSTSSLIGKVSEQTVPEPSQPR